MGIGYLLLYVALAVVALWLFAELLLQNRAPLHWRALALAGFLTVVAGMQLRSVVVIGAGGAAFALGQTLVTLAVKRGTATAWSLRGRDGGLPGPLARIPLLSAATGGAVAAAAVVRQVGEVGPVEEAGPVAAVPGPRDPSPFESVPSDPAAYGVVAHDPVAHDPAPYDPAPYDPGAYAPYGQPSAYDPYGQASPYGQLQEIGDGSVYVEPVQQPEPYPPTAFQPQPGASPYTDQHWPQQPGAGYDQSYAQPGYQDPYAQPQPQYQDVPQQYAQPWEYQQPQAVEQPGYGHNPWGHQQQG
ncbi:hypothetical protein [Kitasatospora sp. HPMI-4]|uniref:hypothetical protein n=1 Tax=Kitasatospora sp. HPMI-4 TaxID=3448443 RepID=UPI003F1BC905